MFPFLEVDVTAAILVAAGVDWNGDQNNHAPSYKAASWPNNTMFMAGMDIYTPLVLAYRQQHANTWGGSMQAKSEPPLLVATSRKAVVGSEYRGYAVVTKHWKLLYMAEQGEGRLFDRDEDPLERLDLFEYGRKCPFCSIHERMHCQLQITCHCCSMLFSRSVLHAEVKSLLLVGLLRWCSQQDDLQWELAEWSSGAAVGFRARNDSMFLTGRAAEYNIQEAAAAADVL